MPDPIDLITADPDTSDPDTFAAQADLAWQQLIARIPQMNTAFTALNLNDTNSTSTTSLTIGTGTKSLTVDTGKSYLPGMSVNIGYTTDGANYMRGTVKTYNSGTGAMDVNVTETGGSGTQTAWSISFGVPYASLPGDLVLLDTVNAAAASQADIENAFTDYNRYVILSDGFTFSNANVSNFIRIKQGGAYQTATYSYSRADAAVTSAASAIDMKTGGDSTSTSITYFRFDLYYPSAVSPNLVRYEQLSVDSGVINIPSIGFGAHGGNAALEGVRIYPSAGTFTGNFYLYGVVD